VFTFISFHGIMFKSRTLVEIDEIADILRCVAIWNMY